MHPQADAEWQPSSGAILGCGLAGLLLVAVGLTLVTDLPGRLLIGAAGAGLLVFAVLSWRARPRLALTDDALVVRGWFRTHRLTRAQIRLIRITEFQRIGRKTRLLEIETADDDLLVLSRWDLGGNPLAVLDALTAAGYAGD